MSERETSWRSSGLRWLKFNFVGLLGIGVQLLALALLTSWLHVNYLLATALAVEAAVVHKSPIDAVHQIQSDKWRDLDTRKCSADEVLCGHAAKSLSCSQLAHDRLLLNLQFSGK